MATSARSTPLLVVDARPHKRFFIDMITRDISLEACVLDLVDNAVDGATRAMSGAPRSARAPMPHPLSAGTTLYRGYSIDISFDRTSFQIQDNCGGLAIDIAREYAFTFGRDPGERTGADTESGIGIYGIGMKRALFKLGHQFTVKSRTQHDAFEMVVDVEDWARRPNWEFELAVTRATGRPGTTIAVSKLREGVAQELGDPAFLSRLGASASRTYAAFLDQGLVIRVNGRRLTSMAVTFLRGSGFQPLHEKFKELVHMPTGRAKARVDMEIWAGAASTSSTDRPDEGTEEDTTPWGWYVLCNNRVVLAGDKSARTGWGVGSFPHWHPQYNGFVGILSFRSEAPYALPWTTTKNDIDIDSPLYRRARASMQVAARSYISYSRARKANPDAAKTIERSARQVAASSVSRVQPMGTPQVPRVPSDSMTIQYQKPRDQIERAAEALGKRGMSASQVGSQTFDYYYNNEVE